MCRIKSRVSPQMGRTRVPNLNFDRMQLLTMLLQDVQIKRSRVMQLRLLMNRRNVRFPTNIPPVRTSVSSPNSPSQLDAAGHQLVLHPQLGDIKHHNLTRADSHGSSLNDDDNICKTTLQCSAENSSENCEFDPLSDNASPIVTRNWLTNHRFTASIHVLGNFSGADILRLSRDDLIQICGIADGIRLFNALHIDRTPARLTIYIRKYNETQYTAVFLRNFHISELRRKLHPLLQDINGTSYVNTPTMFLGGPNGIKIRLTDEVVQNFKPESLYYLEPVDGGIILRPSQNRVPQI